MKLLCCILLLCFISQIICLKSITSISNSRFHQKNLMKRQVLPQLIFTGACAGAIIFYVATHIDEIKEKQRIAVETTMTKQSNDIKSAQEQQRISIENARKQQEEAIRRGLEDARKR